MAKSTSQTCVNCGNEIQSHYCGECGQRKLVSRISFASLFQDLQDKLLGLDTKYLRTVVDLTYKPGYVARSYINGNRRRYVGPVAYFFLAVTLLVILTSVLNIDMVHYTAGTTENITPRDISNNQAEFQQATQQWIFANLKIISFFFIPFYIIATLILFRKNGYNLLENAVFIFFAQGHPQWAGYASLLIFKLTGISFALPVSILSALYMGFFAMDFFTRGAKWLRFIKGLLIFPFGILLIMLIIILLGFLGGLLFPDFFKNLL